jgi:hypothetical protein
VLILRAEDELQEAGSVIANGYLRLDREEWIRVVEKRSAALQITTGGKSGGKTNPPSGPRDGTAGRSVGRLELWGGQDLNLRPTDYESAALTN